MPTTIAISGKGGTGKTTLAALIVKCLTDRGRTVLAVDADPNTNLNELLGLEVEETVGDIREDTRASISDIPAGITKERFIELRMQQCLVESTGLDLVAMGHQEGPGCYCYINTLLRGYLGRLHKNYDYVVIDNEAGMEHLSRRTAGDLDLLLIVSDRSPIALRAAQRIKGIADSLKLRVRKSGLVLNRTAPDQIGGVAAGDLEVLGSVPEDELLTAFSMDGRPIAELPSESKVLRAVAEMMDRLGI